MTPLSWDTTRAPGAMLCPNCGIVGMVGAEP